MIYNLVLTKASSLALTVFSTPFSFDRRLIQVSSFGVMGVKSKSS